MDKINGLVQRWNAPTPPFFQKVAQVGIALAAAGGAILAAPIALPALLIKLAGYALVAGTAIAAVSQTAKTD